MERNTVEGGKDRGKGTERDAEEQDNSQNPETTGSEFRVSGSEFRQNAKPAKPAEPAPASDHSMHSREVAKGSFWGLLGSLAFKLSSFFYVILIARAASPDDVGLFYLTLGIISIITIPSDLGLSGSLIRYVPFFQGRKEFAKVKGLLTLSWQAATSLGILFLAALWLSADYIGQIYNNPGLPEAIRLMSWFILLQNWFRMMTSYLQGMADMKSMQLATNVQNLSKLLLTAAFFYLYGASLFTITMAFLLSHVLAIIFALPGILKLSKLDIRPGETGITRSQLLGEIAPFGFIITLSGIIWSALTSTDRIILGYMMPSAIANETVAIYSISTSLALSLGVFLGAVGNIFMPVMSRLAGTEDQEGMRSIMRTSQRWVLLLTFPAALVMVVYSGEILRLFYGTTYAVGAMTLSLFTLGMIIYSMTYIASLAFISLRMVKTELVVASSAWIANALFCILLIPPFGMDGAAFASVLSSLVMSLVLIHYSRKAFGFTITSEVPRIILAAAVAAVILLLSKPLFSNVFQLVSPQDIGGALGSYILKGLYLSYITVMVGVAVAIFAALTLLFKCIGKEDIAIMKGAMRRAMVPASVIAFSERIASYGIHGS